MFKQLLNMLTANPWFYDRIQLLAGSRIMCERIKKRLKFLKPGMIIVDIGGGTGINGMLVPDGVTYICLDNDLKKLNGLIKRELPAIPLLANGSRLPIATGLVDFSICTFVSHHISNDLLVPFLQELKRIVRPGGRCLFIDAVYDPELWLGRFLWRYDRGGFPRSPTFLEELFSTYFTEVEIREFKIYHRYIECEGRVT